PTHKSKSLPIRSSGPRDGLRGRSTTFPGATLHCPKAFGSDNRPESSSAWADPRRSHLERAYGRIRVSAGLCSWLLAGKVRVQFDGREDAHWLCRFRSVQRPAILGHLATTARRCRFGCCGASSTPRGFHPMPLPVGRGRREAPGEGPTL